MKVLILADGDVAPRDRIDAAWPDWADGIELVIAADGGARHASSVGLRPDLWVGDGDSLGEDALRALIADGVRVERAPVDKDESDTELAVRAALERGASEIVVLGAFGGARIDHLLANVGLLAMQELVGLAIVLLDAGARVGLVTAPAADGAPVTRSLAGRIGDIVSLLPFGHEVAGVTTHGLAYPLRDESLLPGPARGLSNVRVRADAGVVVRRGRLLVVELPATLV